MGSGNRSGSTHNIAFSRFSAAESPTEEATGAAVGIIQEVITIFAAAGAADVRVLMVAVPRTAVMARPQKCNFPRLLLQKLDLDI